MLTKYFNIALILALVAVAGVVKHSTPSAPQRVAAAATVDQPPN